MLLVALAVAPGIFWLWYFLQRDRLRPEPRYLVRLVFFVGGGSAFIAGLLEVGMSAATGLSLEARTAPPLAAAAAIGLIEEGVKFLVILTIVYRHREFNEVLDGIIYAVAASLGFATVENLFYVLSGGVGVGVARALLSVPGHAFFGAVMGYYLGIAPRSRRTYPLTDDLRADRRHPVRRTRPLRTGVHHRRRAGDERRAESPEYAGGSRPARPLRAGERTVIEVSCAPALQWLTSSRSGRRPWARRLTAPPRCVRNE